jgi:hypothetical protein
MSKDLVMNSITWIWLVCLIGIIALAILYWRYTSHTTSGYFFIEDMIFMVQILFVIGVAFRETFHLIALCATFRSVW